MMLVVSGLTATALYYMQRHLARQAEDDLQREFQSELGALHRVQEVRHAALAERCRALVRRPRIHAALEDNALDLLYPSAKDELRDVMDAGDDPLPERVTHALRARFYRFLDGDGAVIPAPNPLDVGPLAPEVEARLGLRQVPDKQQIGYLQRKDATGLETIDEVIAMPIISHETGEAIAALALGFKPVDLGHLRARAGIKSGIWLDGELHLPQIDPAERATLGAEVSRAVKTASSPASSLRVRAQGVPHLLFYKRLNPESLFPPAYEVCIYPLTEVIARQRRLRWEVLGAGAFLLLGGFVASHFVSGRLAGPVKKLVIVSEEDRAQRERAEAALESTHEELQRSARFSADASHQLKTPLTVLRAGLEELLARGSLTPEQCNEISNLVHQTYRLANIIEDLLLLSRMDAGRLQIEFTTVDLIQLMEALLDDLSTMPGCPEVKIESEHASLLIAGEKRYIAIILQNLLENARKYNRPEGRIMIVCRIHGTSAILTIGNTGPPIPPGAREHVFERFHRGAIGENVPGYGLGLNLARELARIHAGDVRLTRSDHDWTEMEVCFQLAEPEQRTTL